ncbi:uncharacterized protein LOC132628031 isoform X1 [Lycium barbarum]|uniref:uncharacterized protein LOC132628031 isoform X1 n=1 Tax=Lycium barbarum TaxID=112863 RepID=UPI00293EAFC4|nr:uncharacterized protein LOC132628031 isoform X1 [Lycium barbarum]
MPDPDAEVVALSPKTLLAMNRFVCEICNKGFQRDQNLQLHRRGHNLPWKLWQRTSNEEQAMRRDNFITHRAFCDVLAKDSEKVRSAVTTPIADEDRKVQAVVSSTPPPPTPPTPPPASEPPAVPSPAAPESLPPPVTPSTDLMSSDSPIQNPELVESPRTNSTGTITKQVMEETTAKTRLSGICSSSSSTGCTTSSSIFPSFTGISSSSRSSSSNGSTTSNSIFPSLTGICGSTRSSSSNGGTGNISTFPSLTGISSSSRNSSSNGSTSSSNSIFASSTGFCSSSSSSSNNGSTRSSSIFTSMTGICSSSSSSSSNRSASSSTFASLFSSSTSSGSLPLPSQAPQFTDWFQSVAPAPPPDIEPASSMEPISLCLANLLYSEIIPLCHQNLVSRP